MRTEPVSNVLVLSAPAKVNLFLEILARRPDGYHDLVTCMVLLDLEDTLTFQPAAELELTCDRPGLSTGPDNLVWRAADVLRQHSGYAGGAAIHLTKRIPAEAGLGGGSSDAATTLVGLNRLWNLRVPVAELARLAARLGSDVPFFLSGKAAWCTGRGEHVAPFEMPTDLHFVLVCPPVGLSTAAVYRQVEVPAEPRPTESMRQALARGDAAAIGASLFNRLQAPAERLCPAVAALRQTFDNLAPHGWVWGHQMTGSGSSYFAVCRDTEAAARCARLLSGQEARAPGRDGTGATVLVVRSKRPGPP
jgi:4-diphosphocytidyl-2-C-methyl-D-erythritol kinase